MVSNRVDVVIVGAGLSGLMTARLLQEWGLQVQVLEARQAVGGRLQSTLATTGSVVDLGGQWGGATHHRLAALVEDLGLERYPSHYAGDGVLFWRGQLRPPNQQTIGAQVKEPGNRPIEHTQKRAPYGKLIRISIVERSHQAGKQDLRQTDNHAEDDSTKQGFHGIIVGWLPCPVKQGFAHGGYKREKPHA